MSYDEEHQKRSRVVIETPTARREVVQTTTARAPERRGIPASAVAALVIGSVALVTILFLFILNRQSSETTVNANVRSAATAPTPAQQPIIIQQPTPAPQQPIIIQQPPPVAGQPPVIVEQPAAPPATTGNAVTTTARPSGTDDATIQSEIDKRISQNATLSTADVTATVIEGKVTLIGTVDSQAIKNQVERLIKGVKGVKAVDNQLIVPAG